jgi:peptidoglycan hydrolase-like protein with peptidoglycan-binding domain/S1-C subfamily serine protease
MFRPVAVFAVVLSALFLIARLGPAMAQEDTVWLQVEALPDLPTANERARAYATVFPETAGFQLRSGWYGIMLGPYPADEVAVRLNALKRDGQIPDDSFIAYAANFRDQFWPAGDAAVPLAATEAPEAVQPVTPEPVEIPDETRQEARDSEVLLTPEERKDLQVALQWFGFYEGAIDGDYGPGTRNSMATWQEAQGMIEPTGILTTRQRRVLLDGWRGEIAAFGFTEVVEAKAGITVTLPLGLVEFDHYEPPFVHFRPKTETDPRIVLISQPGDQALFNGLYDILQTLDAVPLDGARERGERVFRIRGTSAKADTTVYAELQGGLIKGWMLISTPGNEARDTRILRQLETTFAPTGDIALDPGTAVMSTETRVGLLSGLEVRKPRFSRTGFFINSEGAVLTTTEAVQGCGRVTIDLSTEATVALSDTASGLVLLVPSAPLAPREVAGFLTTTPRPGSEVIVSGYSYEDRLPAPVLTFGTLEDVTGLNGEPGLDRLTVQTLPGDAGGPVLDATGSVIGMLLPAGPQGGKQLPSGVVFALSASEIARILTPTGIEPQTSLAPAPLSPSALTDTATGMTALVSCWD